MIIRECTFDEVKHLVGPAKKERSCLTDGKNHHWVCAEALGAVVGSSCAFIMTPSHARIKGGYVAKEFRGQKLSSQMNNLALEICGRHNVSQVSVFVTEKAKFWAASRGFIETKSKNSIAYMVKNV